MTASTVVGRFVRQPGIDYGRDDPDAVTVERYWHAQGQHAAWCVTVTWHAGTPQQTTEVVDTNYHQPGAACETAGWEAIRRRFTWDRASFPNGLIR